ncbi:MAG TPA: hypothetical protein VFU94_04050 [Conexibacter sp.]|nr:hypothetical protein [Conexibacter sp.]
MGDMPSAFDQIKVSTDEATLGLSVSSPEAQVARVSRLPFEMTAVVLSKLATHAEHAREHDRQLELVRWIFGTTPIWPRVESLVRNRDMQMFPEQHLIALMRMLVMYANDEPLTERLSDANWEILLRALIAMGTVNDAGLLRRDTRDDRLAYLVQNGAYYHHEPPMEALARTYRLFSEIPRLPGLVDHRDRVPIDEWLQEETQGLSLDQQSALGFALLAVAHALDENAQANDRSVLTTDTVADLAARIGAPFDSVVAAVSARREWYRDQFTRCDDLGAPWNRVPFEQRPFLQLADGRVALWHVRCLMSWLTEGIHYRLLDAARRHRKVSQYTRYLGALTERYALEVVRDAHPGPRRLGVGVVHGEYPYGGRRGKEKRTPDVAIDYGQDLVLIEVCSRRLSLASRRGGDPAVVRADLDKMLGRKLEQLGKSARDLLRSDASLPGVDISNVLRVWPIVVTGSGLLENPMLWAYIDEHTALLRSLGRVQPVSVFDLGDLEQLAGLIEAGYGLVDILRRKTSGPYARLDLRRFVFDAPYLTHRARANSIELRWAAAIRTYAHTLGFDPDQVGREAA